MKMRSILVIAVLGFIFMLGLTLQLANAMPLMNDRPQNHRLFITDPLPNSAASWLPGYTPTVNVTITGTGPSNLSHQESDSLIRDGLLIWEEPIYRYQQQTRVWNLLTNQIEWQWTIDHTNKYIQFAFSNHDPNSVQLTVSWVPNNQKFMSEEDGLTSFNDLSKEEEGMIALGYADRTTNTIYLNSSWHWDRYQLYRFKKIITHEFGHILNFAHNDYFEYVNDNLVVSIMHRGSEALWWNGWIMNELFGIEYQLGPIKDQIEFYIYCSNFLDGETVDDFDFNELYIYTPAWQSECPGCNYDAALALWGPNETLFLPSSEVFFIYDHDVHGFPVAVPELSDAISVLRILTSIQSHELNNVAALDVDADGKIGLSDAIFILQLISGFR